MDDRELAKLFEGYLADSLDAEGAVALERHLQADPAAIEQLALQAHVQGTLRHAAQPPLDREAIMQRLPRRRATVERAVMAFVRSGADVPALVGRRVRLWWLGWATATVLAGTTALAWIARPSVGPTEGVAVESLPVAAADARFSVALTPSRPPAPPSQGPVLRRRMGTVMALFDDGLRPVSAGASLVAGAALLSLGPESGATIELGRGARVDLGADTLALRLGVSDAGKVGGGPEVILARGRATVQVLRADDDGLVVGFPGGMMTSSSARVRIQATTESTRIEVLEGHARLRATASVASTELSVGQFAQVTDAGRVTTGARAPGPQILLVANRKELVPSDRALEARLAQLGFRVEIATPLTMQLEQAREADLLVVSATVDPEEVSASLRDLPVPLLTTEVGILPLLGMTSRCEEEGCGWLRSPFPELRIEIADAVHPMAAGMSGVVAVGDLRNSGWGAPGPGASWSATMHGQPTRAVLFGHDRGTLMPGGLPAPARRVGCGLLFLDRGLERLKPDSVAWKLFDSSVRWAVGGS